MRCNPAIRRARHERSHGAVDRFPELAGDLLRLDIDVLLVGGTIAARAAKAHGATLASGLLPKQLEFLRAAAPKISRVSVVYNPVNPSNEFALRETQDAAKAMRMELQPLPVRRPGELAGTFAALVRWKAGGVLAVSDATLVSSYPRFRDRQPGSGRKSLGLAIPQALLVRADHVVEE
jgi:hypothetical protein